ncbi:MAG: EF-P 5-aminopentanol modification-associated protein YfmH [Oscillospiraceae bacterium]
MSNRKTVIESKITGDKIVKIEHSSGLDIFVCEMEGFSTTEALFGTKYGSINTTFKTTQDADFTTVPEGIAHFLEHKLFENEDTDVFELYAKTGASANAFTSFDKTCYMFDTSENVYESLKILLTFVQQPYFTKENVDKEQGIIGQEIQMCNDNPSWKVFFNMLKGMYHNHPVKIDIAGTIDSIAQIDAPLLYKCYNTFYNLNNMVLSIAGNVKVDEVLKIADECLKPCKDIHLETISPEEPETIVQSEIVEHLPVGVPIFYLGFKSKPEVGFENIKAEMEAYLVANTIADASSPLYENLLNDGLINSEFAVEVFNGDGFFSVIFSGESSNVHEVKKRIFAEIEKAKIYGLDKSMFELVKKSVYGSFIREYNNVSDVANNMINSYMAGVLPFDTLDILVNVSYEDAQKCLMERFNFDKSVLSIIE